MAELTILDEREIFGKRFGIFGDLENPLFLAQDVADLLDYDSNNINKMVDSVDELEKLTGTIFRSGQNREMRFLTEDGLYEVLMLSRKLKAKQFKKQVKEILKSIRKHGGYLTPAKIEEALLNPDVLIKLATTLKEERAARVEAETKLQIAQPKADTFDNMSDDEGPCWTFIEAAKIMCLPGVNSNTLRRLARGNGLLLQGENEPTAHAVRNGMMRMMLKSVRIGSHEKIVSTPVIRPKAYDLLYRQIRRGGLF
jgi:anti-repressor protein